MAWFDRCHGCDHVRDRHGPRGCQTPGCGCEAFTRRSAHEPVFVAGGGHRRVERRPPRLPADEH